MNPSSSTADAGREILWNLPSVANQVVMYGLFVLSLIICLWGLWRRYRLWTSGVAEPHRLRQWGQRFCVLWEDVLSQRRVNRERAPRIFHGLILWGFIVLLFATTIVLIDHDFGWRIYRGPFYLAVTLLADLFGLGLFFGLCYAIYRRYITRPDHLHNTRGDALMLLLLVLLVVQGFCLEGMRIRATGDPWALYSPVGYLFSLFFWSLSTKSIQVLHYIFWWFHTITVFVFFALIPYTKFLHIISSSANLFFTEKSRPKGALKYPGDIQTLLETAAESDDDADFGIGISTIENLSWKQRLDLDACTSCGRCQNECPAYRSGKTLSPKWLILDARDHMLSLFADGKLDSNGTSAQHLLDRLDRFLVKSLVLRDHQAEGNGYFRAQNELVQQARKSVGQAPDDQLYQTVMEEDVFWACTSCRACMEVCPVAIEHIDLIMDVRRSMVLMEGKIPSEAQPALRAIETRGNPFGPAESRADWADGLEVPIIKEGDTVEVLYWVGCVSAFDKRKQKIARSMASILNASGLKWGILGDREQCTGDPARRLGEENLFQTAAKNNIALLKSVTFDTVVANCPHCFNTLKNEYPVIEDFSNGRDVRVLHHIQLIKELIASDAISVSESTARDITFHDPCYLGRYNDIYQEPREILQEIGGHRLTEMKDSCEKGLCCGAGGGHYWFDMKVGQRINVLRVDQAAETGADLVATGCPFCMQMLEDAVGLTEREDSLEVRDIAEIVAEALVVRHA